jgi:hypothetical protein
VSSIDPSEKVCFAGSMVAGAPLMMIRQTLGESIRPVTVIFFVSTVDSSIGESKSMSPPFAREERVSVVSGVATVTYAEALLSFIQSVERESGLIGVMRDVRSSIVRALSDE